MPVAHNWQSSPPSGPVAPASQRQAVEDILPLAEVECEGHAMHDVAPPADEYVPASHSKHVSTEAAPEWFEYLPATQSAQVVSEIDPEAAEFLPGLHN